MLSQAWLVSDADTLFKRLTFIEGYQKDFKKLKIDIDQARQTVKTQQRNLSLDERTKTLLEIMAFYDGIELYLRPMEHGDLFASNKYIMQNHVTEIYNFTQPTISNQVLYLLKPVLKNFHK